MSEQNINQNATQQRLNANQVLSCVQTLIAENITDGNEVRDILCALAGDILINGFKVERMEGRVVYNQPSGEQIVSLVGITAEVFQKIPVQNLSSVPSQEVGNLPQQPDSTDDGETSPTEHSGRTADGKASLAEQFDRAVMPERGDSQV